MWYFISDTQVGHVHGWNRLTVRCACTLFIWYVIPHTRAHDFRVERIHFIVLVHWIRTGALHVIYVCVCVPYDKCPEKQPSNHPTKRVCGKLYHFVTNFFPLVTVRTHHSNWMQVKCVDESVIFLWKLSNHNSYLGCLEFLSISMGSQEAVEYGLKLFQQIDQTKMEWNRKLFGNSIMCDSYTGNTFD